MAGALNIAQLRREQSLHAAAGLRIKVAANDDGWMRRGPTQPGGAKKRFRLNEPLHPTEAEMRVQNLPANPFNLD